MGYTFYDGAILVNQRLIKSLSHILHEAEKRPDASALLEARLYEDMYPLADQIRLATQFSENIAAKLTGREPVTFEGKPTTFAQSYERIETVLKTLNEADKDFVNQHADDVGTVQFGGGMSAEMSGTAYVHTVALPNINFHVVTAYGILRKEGVTLGKRDFLSGFLPHIGAGSQ